MSLPPRPVIVSLPPRPAITSAPAVPLQPFRPEVPTIVARSPPHERAVATGGRGSGATRRCRSRRSRTRGTDAHRRRRRCRRRRTSPSRRHRSPCSTSCPSRRPARSAARSRRTSPPRPSWPMPPPSARLPARACDRRVGADACVRPATENAFASIVASASPEQIANTGSRASSLEVLDRGEPRPRDVPGLGARRRAGLVDRPTPLDGRRRPGSSRRFGRLRRRRRACRSGQSRMRRRRSPRGANRERIRLRSSRRRSAEQIANTRYSRWRAAECCRRRRTRPGDVSRGRVRRRTRSRRAVRSAGRTPNVERSTGGCPTPPPSDTLAGGAGDVRVSDRARVDREHLRLDRRVGPGTAPAVAGQSAGSRSERTAASVRTARSGHERRGTAATARSTRRRRLVVEIFIARPFARHPAGRGRRAGCRSGRRCRRAGSSRRSGRSRPRRPRRRRRSPTRPRRA